MPWEAMGYWFVGGYMAVVSCFALFFITLVEDHFDEP